MILSNRILDFRFKLEDHILDARLKHCEILVLFFFFLLPLLNLAMMRVSIRCKYLNNIQEFEILLFSQCYEYQLAGYVFQV